MRKLKSKWDGTYLSPPPQLPGITWGAGVLSSNSYSSCRGMLTWHTSVQFSSVAQSCPALCVLMNRSTPGLHVHHQLPEFTKLMSIELVMPSSHLILYCPLLPLPPIPPSMSWIITLQKPNKENPLTSLMPSGVTTLQKLELCWAHEIYLRSIAHSPPLESTPSLLWERAPVRAFVDCDLSLVGYLGKAQEEGGRETTCVYSRAKRVGGVE